ncbi:hypothetical protein SAMN05216379_11062 [Nitrosomonas eutropha]|nr:hypothetical protein [Nitrosomonas sp. GH22]SCX16258.1 hypothetical protein SAMN05216379_11062 [Nitrosomonas eutropha]
MFNRQTVTLLVLNICMLSAFVFIHWILLDRSDDLSTKSQNVPSEIDPLRIPTETLPNALEQTLLFSSSRTRTVISPPESTGSLDAIPPHLVGIVEKEGHKRFALLEDETATSRKLVTQGEAFEVWVVVSITSDAIYLRNRSNINDGSHPSSDIELRLRPSVLPSQNLSQ